MKYIFWFAFIIVVIGSLTKKQQNAYIANPSYIPSNRESVNPRNYAPNTFHNLPASQEAKPKIERKQSRKQRKQNELYGASDSHWPNQSTLFEDNRDIYQIMEKMKSNSHFNQTDWEKLERESEARFEAISRFNSSSANWNNTTREINSSTTLSNYSNSITPSSIWSNSSGSSNNNTSSYSYPGTSNTTYTSGGTEYYTNDTYTTTGKPKVKRNMTTRSHFLHSLGYDKVPEGYEVDHTIPLSQGGSDTPDNMQLLTKEDHRRKTASERANTTYSPHSSSFYSSPTIPASTFSSPATLPTTSQSHEIHTGPRGGQFYYNSSGNKTYIKN